MNKNILESLKTSIFNLPIPANISYYWNFGSLLGISLFIQIISGLILTMLYTPDMNLAFLSVNNICREVNNGWFWRMMHANNASFFFMFIYLHIGRGIYYQSYKLKFMWITGMILYFISMMTAFLGYVLPWGQMSFWGGSVITNLISTIPFLGNNIVQWIWAGFSLNNATLTRFFTLHFILPFLILMMMFIHLMILHITGSTNPTLMNSNINKINFHPYFSYKDLISTILYIYLLIFLMMNFPYMLSDPDNFILANPMITPIHIQPEWYFLFAYAILRSVPNKLGGVISLIMSIFILMFLIFINSMNKMNKFMIFNKILFWTFTMVMILLTWIGMRSVEPPYIETGQILTIIYFSYFIYQFK